MRARRLHGRRSAVDLGFVVVPFLDGGGAFSCKRGRAGQTLACRTQFGLSLATIGFIFLLGIMMVAAPGVPGGAIMAAVGLLQSQLGFDDGQVALMIAAYIAIDSFGTACNVTGDGAIALAVNKLARGELRKSDSQVRSEVSS